jgi:hypothetical protein
MASTINEQDLRAVSGGTKAPPQQPGTMPLFYFDNQKHKYNQIKVDHGFMQIATGALQPGFYQIGPDGRLSVLK